MAKERRKFTQCPNCGYTFEDINNYCPNCGQENHDLNVPVKHLIAEFFEGTLHFDTKVWKTLKYLILKPGLLTEKFNVGKRASYVPPFRLYVFVSLIFFFVLALTTESSVKVGNTNATDAGTKAILPGVTINANVADSLERAADSAALRKADILKSNKELQALQSELAEDEFVARFADKFSKFSSSGEESKQKLFKNLSFMMFLLMPFFAFVLYLYYRKQDRNYVEHLMFSIHLHTFYFILLIVAMLLGKLLPSLDFELVVFGIMILYLFLALRYVYKQTYLRTLLSLLPIAFAYFVTLAIFFVGTVFVSVLMS